MDAVLLSRIQFGLTAGFHFLFPPLSIGLSVIIVILEFMYLKKKSGETRVLSDFIIKIFGLVFTLGVATGIVLEFSFGTNWAEYSRLVGDIFGPPLAAEGILAFFLESVFLGVLLFGRKKVSPRAYFISAFMVSFGSHLSGLWIIIANSWMQTPAGFELVNGKAVLTDFFAAALNPSALNRYLHVIVASWITGALFTAGLSSWYLLKGKFNHLFKGLLRISLAVFIAAALFQFVSGHMHAIQVAEYQPEKMAAFEALWKTQERAPMSLIGIPDSEKMETHFEVKVPALLSLLIHLDPEPEVKGLESFPKEEWPPVALTYFSYHIMIATGSLFALISILGIFLSIRKKLFRTRWYLWLIIFTMPFPFISNEFGWMAAEIGRQPWAVYGVLKTADAASVTVPGSHILFSLIMFTLIYMLLLAVFLKILKNMIAKGPETERIEKDRG